MHYENSKKFEKPMNPTKLLAVYTKKQGKYQTIATNAKEPVSDEMMVNSRLLHAVETDLMTNAYHNGNEFPTWNECGIDGEDTSMMHSINFKS